MNAWADELSSRRPDVIAVGYFGSYARGDHGVGSDLDLVVVVDRSDADFVHRPAGFDALRLPVPADLLVYTAEEWGGIRADRRGPAGQPIVWVHQATGELVEDHDETAFGA